jgi:hypothetical protein
MVAGMDAGRRQLLQLCGGLGLAVALGACSQRTRARQGAEPETPVNSVPLTDAGGPPETVAAPQSVPPPVAEPTPPSGVLLCREAWGARPALPGGRPHRITRMTIHHSGVVLSDNRTIAERLRQHQRYHQDEHGWIDIAYHVGIDLDGNIFELRDTGLIGDTATDYDPAGHFLVLCEGNFDEQAVPEAQLESVALVLAWAAQTFQIRTDTLASHRDLTSGTSCPGADLQAYVVSGEIRRRVDDLAGGGPIGLEWKCGHEGAAIMAAIEAGR